MTRKRLKIFLILLAFFMLASYAGVVYLVIAREKRINDLKDEKNELVAELNNINLKEKKCP